MSTSHRRPSSTLRTRFGDRSGCGLRNRCDLALYREPPQQRNGIDYLEETIRRAKLKASERGLVVTFLVRDATTL